MSSHRGFFYKPATQRAVVLHSSHSVGAAKFSRLNFGYTARAVNQPLSERTDVHTMNKFALRCFTEFLYLYKNPETRRKTIA